MKRNIHDEVYWTEKQQEAHLLGIRSNDLLCCPFCESSRIKLKSGKGLFDRVQCLFCGVTGPWYDGHPSDAISGWNAMPRKHKDRAT